jgi:hypothetical protein
MMGGCDASFVDQRPGDDALPLDSRLGDGGSIADAVLSGDNGLPGQPDAGTDGVSGPTVYARGAFSGRSDYQGVGQAELVRRGDVIELRFSDDFATSAVPGPVVVLSSRPDMGSAIRGDLGDVELGVLKSTSGAQTYPLPGGDEGRRYAWIYCKPFGVEVARAQMEDL